MQLELDLAMRRVGASILQCREEGNITGKWKGSQFKAAADLIANEYLRNELRLLADIPIISEEDIISQSMHRPPEYWLIDPIDGTASFAEGFSGFVTQVALIQYGQPCLAAVFAPALERLYMAEKGKGATVNGHPMRVRTSSLNALTLIDNYPQPRGIAEYLFHNLDCVNYLESGSIGLKICLVAEGKADIFVKDVFVRDWDVAPPHLVLLEAGGVLTQFAGESFDYDGDYDKRGLVVTSSAALHKQINGIINNYGSNLWLI
jgi:3'-phosphoadenosine 5'-phosphosulfate (PAPS) 3'-phosphatase